LRSPLDAVSFQHPANGRRGKPQLLSDLCHGQAFFIEAGPLGPVHDQPRPSADAPLLAGLLEAGKRALLIRMRS
jgi:hypothetical protein